LLVKQQKQASPPADQRVKKTPFGIFIRGRTACGVDMRDADLRQRGTQGVAKHPSIERHPILDRFWLHNLHDYISKIGYLTI
jgi:hypothetical protein